MLKIPGAKAVGVTPKAHHGLQILAYAMVVATVEYRPPHTEQELRHLLGFENYDKRHVGGAPPFGAAGLYLYLLDPSIIVTGLKVVPVSTGR